MAGFCVRDATPGDCQTIVDMIVELAVYEKEKPSRVKITKDTLIRDGFGEKRWFRCLVAEIQDVSTLNNENQKTVTETQNGEVSTNEKTLVGYTLFFPTYSTWNGRTMKLEDLYVKPDYRGKGCGSALLKEVTRLALAEDCIRVHWCVLDWNQPAIDYYKYIGAEYQPQWRTCSLHHSDMLAFVK